MHFSPEKQTTVLLLIDAVVLPFNIPPRKANNCWRCIAAHFLGLVNMLLRAFLPRKAADSAIMD